MSRDDHRTPPTLRESSINIARGPIYAALARDLSGELYRLRLERPADAHKIGTLARDADRLAVAFDGWTCDTPRRAMEIDVADWQELRALAKLFGSRVLT